MIPFMRWLSLLAIVLSLSALQSSCADDAPDRKVLTISADELEDRIRGGMLAQIIGNLNGLPHEFKYIDEPGNVEHYTPSLPDGAQTDDDTDLEWVYLHEIAASGNTRIPPARIVELWKSHINRRIWCANLYARRLMDLGVEPPWTGNVMLNPWSEFNISGQFVCESFGLMAPAMPQTAAEIGLHYTRVTIDGEPAQTTQLFTTMISLAFVEHDVDRLLDAGLAAVDPKSRVAQVVRETRVLCAAHPNDWRKTREQIKQRWQTHGGGVRDRNGYELNTASTIAALIYGKKDFVETLRLAFNFGWDCDNNAATSATIIGVIKGRRWMDEQSWDIADRYRNTTRDNMPMDETLTSLENKLIQCARIAIKEQGDSVPGNKPRHVYGIRPELPANIQPLATPAIQLAQVREHFANSLKNELGAKPPANARAAYVAIALDDFKSLEQSSPTEWSSALKELNKHDALISELFKSPNPRGPELRKLAARAGLVAPNLKLNSD